MKHTVKDLIASIDRHAPRNWRRAASPEPRLLALPELSSFALSSNAFAKRDLWNEALAEPKIGFPVITGNQYLKSYLMTHQTQTHGVIHFGTPYSAEIAWMMQIQNIPSYLAGIVHNIRRGADDVFQETELFWSDNTVRLRFVNT